MLDRLIGPVIAAATIGLGVIALPFAVGASAADHAAGPPGERRRPLREPRGLRIGRYATPVIADASFAACFTGKPSASSSFMGWKLNGLTEL